MTDTSNDWYFNTLTTEDIEQREKLIADFMISLNPHYNANQHKQFAYLNISDGTQIGYGGQYPPYHFRWEYIMPVIEEISSLHIINNQEPANPPSPVKIEIIPNDGVTISGFTNTPPIIKYEKKEGSLIMALWLAIIDFIQWYNKYAKQ